MRSVLPLAALAALTACDDTIFEGGGGGDDSGAIEGSDFCAVQTIFDASCTAGCHSGGAGAAGGLDLSEGASYDNLVDQPSLGYEGEILVIPGDSAGSFLYLKVTGQQGDLGSGMPLGEGSLPASEAQVIADWIDAGAGAECDAADTGGDSGDGGDGGGGDGGDSGDSGDSGDPALGTDWCAIDAYFQGTCVGCHSASLAKTYSYLDLESEGAHGRLVDVASAQYDGETLVVAKDRDGSFLYKKLAGTHGDQGSKMPLGGEASADQLEAVGTWIDAGATETCD